MSSSTLQLVRQTTTIAVWSFAVGFLLERNQKKLPLIHQYIMPKQEGVVNTMTVRLLVGSPEESRTALKWTMTNGKAQAQGSEEM